MVKVIIIFICIFYFRYCIILVSKFLFGSEIVYLLRFPVFSFMNIFSFTSLIIVIIAALKFLSAHSDTWNIFELASVDCHFSWEQVTFSYSLCQVILDCILGIVMLFCRDWIVLYAAKKLLTFLVFVF